MDPEGIANVKLIHLGSKRQHDFNKSHTILSAIPYFIGPHNSKEAVSNFSTSNMRMVTHMDSLHNQIPNPQGAVYSNVIEIWKMFNRSYSLGALTGKVIINRVLSLVEHLKLARINYNAIPTHGEEYVNKIKAISEFHEKCFRVAAFNWHATMYIPNEMVNKFINSWNKKYNLHMWPVELVMPALVTTIASGDNTDIQITRTTNNGCAFVMRKKSIVSIHFLDGEDRFTTGKLVELCAKIYETEVVSENVYGYDISSITLNSAVWTIAAIDFLLENPHETMANADISSAVAQISAMQ